MDALLLKVLNHYNENKPVELSKLKGDASSREYYRDQKNNLIICHYHSDKIGFDHFIQLQKILVQNKINVPKVLHAEFPVLIQEDLGNLELNQCVTNENYSKVIKSLIDWQKLPTSFEYKKEETKFTFDKFMWELEFGQTHLDTLIKKEENFNLKADFESICKDILKDEQCPCHRDFHSKNLMVNNNVIYVIDFQDARLGPLLYDLVSFVEDPYVDLGKEEKKRLKNEFISLSTFKTKESFEGLYIKTAIQRLFKACGSFASQKNLKDKNEYLQYLTPALKNLCTLLETTDYKNLKAYINLNLKLWTQK